MNAQESEKIDHKSKQPASKPKPAQSAPSEICAKVHADLRAQLRPELRALYDAYYKK